MLIRHGADVNAYDKNFFGLDNLSVACARRSSHLANILIKAGHRKLIPKHSSQEADLIWLQSVCKASLSLFDLCRIRIRNFCKEGQLFDFIDALPLPNSIKRLLKLEDEGYME